MVHISSSLSFHSATVIYAMGGVIVCVSGSTDCGVHCLAFSATCKCTGVVKVVTHTRLWRIFGGVSPYIMKPLVFVLHLRVCHQQS